VPRIFPRSNARVSLLSSEHVQCSGMVDAQDLNASLRIWRKGGLVREAQKKKVPASASHAHGLIITRTSSI
jgi:hypothetical protein